MSGRSSRHKRAPVAAVALALAACGGSKAPEADPAKVTELAARMVAAMPAPSAVRECTAADYANTLPITFRSLMLVGGTPIPEENMYKDWINPVELDAPGIRTLLDPVADGRAKKRAAAQILAAKAFLVHKVDVVNAPIALEIKHLARGTVHARVIRFDAKAKPVCVSQVEFQNDEKKSDWAISVSTKALIDPEVARLMREDLRDQYLMAAPRSAPAKP